MSKSLSTEIQILVNKFNAKRYTEILKKISILIKTNKNNDFLWNLSGLCFQQINKTEEAIYSFQKSIDLNQKNIAAKNNLALCHKKIKNYKKAKEILNEILKVNPNYLNAIVNLANLNNETYYLDEALNLFETALKINNNIPEIHLNIANIYQSTNQIDKAKSLLKKTLNSNPGFTQADQILSMLTNYNDNKNNDHIEGMIKKLNNENLKSSQKLYLHFALGKSYEDKKNFDKAFFHFEKGNKIKAGQNKNQIKNLEKLSKNLKKFFFNRNFNNTKPDNGNNIIFILGLPRSGTSLLEKIISSHSKVCSVSEVNFLFDKINKNILENNEFNLSMTKKFLENDLLKEFNQFLKNFNINKDIIIDKTLFNFWYIGFIKLFFPNSPIIHSFRNAKDNCLSIYKNLFPTSERWLYDQEDIAKYYLIYEDLMKFWNEIFEGKILNVKYEDLINNSENKIREIIKFCKLDWEEQCLKHQNNKNPIKTLSVNQANKPIYDTSINISANYEGNLNKMFAILDK